MYITLTCSRDCQHYRPSPQIGKGVCSYSGRNSADLVNNGRDCEYGFTISTSDCVTSPTERREDKKRLQLFLQECSLKK